MLGRSRFLLCLVLALPVLALPWSGSAAPAPPDLRASSVSVSVAEASSGQPVLLKARVKNHGGRKAARSRVAWWLSRDLRVSASDTRLGPLRLVPGLARGRSVLLTSKIGLPAVAPGTYRVLACADAARAVRESKEGNNCAAAPARLEVVPAAGESVWSGSAPRLRVTDVGNQHLTLVWPSAARDAGVTGFTVSWDGGSREVAADTPEVTVADLSPGTAYSLRVAARRADGVLDPQVLTTTARTATGLEEPLDLRVSTGHPRASEVAGADGFSGPRDTTSEAVLRGAEWEYHLAVPNAAMPSDETFRLSEVTSVPGFSTSGGLVAGVRMEPSGLLLAEPATLVIRRRDGAAPPTDAIPLVFERSGEQARLVAMDPLSQEYTFQVSHFSGIVVMSGSVAEMRALVDNASSQIERLANETAAALAEERQRVMVTGEEQISPATLELLRQSSEEAWQHALTLLHAATSNDRLAQRAVSTAIGLLRQDEMMGVDHAERSAQLLELLPLIMQNAYDSARHRCAVNLDPREAAQMLGHARSAEMAGVTLTWSMDDVMTCAATRVRVGLVAEFETFNAPRGAGVCCGWYDLVAGTLQAETMLEPVRQGKDLFYVGHAEPVLGALRVEHHLACDVSTGAPRDANAVPFVVTPGFNWHLDPDAPVRFRVDVTDLGPAGTELPPLRTTFAASYAVATESGCNHWVQRDADVWNNLLLTFAGIRPAWTLPVGTTTMSTADERYEPANLGGAAEITVTLAATR